MSDVKELVEELRTTANEAESALDLTGFVAGALGWPHDISDSSLRTLLGATLRDFVKFFHEANLFVLVPREAADLLEQQAEAIRRLREGLKYLAAETKGLLGIAAEEVRAAVGVTNVNCLRRRTEEALVLLRETGRPVGEGE